MNSVNKQNLTTAERESTIGQLFDEETLRMTNARSIEANEDFYRNLGISPSTVKEVASEGLIGLLPIIDTPEFRRDLDRLREILNRLMDRAERGENLSPDERIVANFIAAQSPSAL